MKIKKNLSLFEGGVIVSSRDTREIGRITTQESTLRKKNAAYNKEVENVYIHKNISKQTGCRVRWNLGTGTKCY